jgi:glycosyltransferase involved in cell wall biosynthesis
MNSRNIKFTILITTKNRLEDLTVTLLKIDHLLLRDDVACTICDDGSTDGTSDFIKANYPNIQLIRNEKSKGYIYNRNLMLKQTKSEYAISFDDDSCFISENPLQLIEDYFNLHPNCGLIAFRIFWSKTMPESTATSDLPQRVRGFVGCAHVWRMSAWNQIPAYPTWFVFYGEEDFASYQLFKKNIEVHYLPSVLVHHRVDLRARKLQADYMIRLKCSLRSSWSLFLLFFPLTKIPRLLLYTIWVQIKLKVLKGDFKVLQAIILAIIDVLCSIPKIVKHSNRLTMSEYDSFQKLEEVKVYWRPEK